MIQQACIFAMIAVAATVKAYLAAEIEAVRKARKSGQSISHIHPFANFKLPSFRKTVKSV